MEDKLEGRNIAKLRHDLENIFDKRAHKLVFQLIHDYRANALEHDKMVGTIAELAGMHEIIDKLTRQLGESDA